MIAEISTESHPREKREKSLSALDLVFEVQKLTRSLIWRAEEGTKQSKKGGEGGNARRAHSSPPPGSLGGKSALKLTKKTAHTDWTNSPGKTAGPGPTTAGKGPADRVVEEKDQTNFAMQGSTADGSYKAVVQWKKKLLAKKGAQGKLRTRGLVAKGSTFW